MTNLEKRLALVEGHEAAVVSQLRTAEAAAAEGESAAAENASLREQLRELKRDRSQLEQHKMVGFVGPSPTLGSPSISRAQSAGLRAACMEATMASCAWCLSAQSLLPNGLLHMRATATTAFGVSSPFR